MSDVLLEEIALLRGFDVAALDVAGLQAVAGGLRRVQSWVDVSRARVLGQLSAKGASSTLTVLAADNASAAETARRKNCATAVAMAPELATALASGDITAEHVAAVARVRNKASVPDAALGLLAQARDASPEEFRRRLAAWDDRSMPTMVRRARSAGTPSVQCRSTTPTTAWASPDWCCQAPSTR